MSGDQKNAAGKPVLPEEIEAQLRCPVCLYLPSGEVVQCVNGHHFCSACKPGLYRCPICRVPLTTTYPYVMLQQLIQALGQHYQLPEEEQQQQAAAQPVIAQAAVPIIPAPAVFNLQPRQRLVIGGVSGHVQMLRDQLSEGGEGAAVPGQQLVLQPRLPRSGVQIHIGHPGAHLGEADLPEHQYGLSDLPVQVFLPCTSGGQDVYRVFQYQGLSYDV